MRKKLSRSFETQSRELRTVLRDCLNLQLRPWQSSFGSGYPAPGWEARARVILKYLTEHKGVVAVDLSTMIGYEGSSTLSRIFRRESRIGLDKLCALACIQVEPGWCVNLEWILLGRGDITVKVGSDAYEIDKVNLHETVKHSLDGEI